MEYNFFFTLITRSEIERNFKTHISIPRLKYFLFLASLFCGVFLIVFTSNQSKFENYRVTIITDISDEINATIAGESGNTYTIRTEGCTIDELLPFSEMTNEYISKPDFVNCTDGKEEALTDRNRTSFWIVESLLPVYNVTEKELLSCCYQYFVRPSFIEDIDIKGLDNRVEYENCTEFSTVVHAVQEMVHVKCHYNYTLIYEDFYVFPVMRKDLEKNKANESEFNVLILGIDAVSRLNFHRTMPKTQKYLDSLNAIELLGYNKVADNTFPNLIPILTGLWEEHLKGTCVPMSNSYYDNCPILWNWYKNAGFVTAFGEDSGILASFNYFRNGFMRSPTDYYLRTFLHESEDEIGWKKEGNTYFCLGGRLFYEVLLDYVYNFAETMKNLRYFGLFWEVSMSHDYLNQPMLMDDKYETFFKNLSQNGLLNDTIVIIMSDHGMRWGDFRETKQGRLEERLPLLMFLLPERFKANHREAFESLLTNRERLTTPFDLHETLLNLVSVESIRDDVLNKRKQEFYATQRGISLFLPIPSNRTCALAEIKDHWCTCRQSKPIVKNSTIAKQAANLTVIHLNNLLGAYPQCSKLELSEILNINEFNINESVLKESSVGWSDYTLVLRVKPSKGVFEATLRRNSKGDWVVSGTVSRLNLYGSQSECVDDVLLKLYCFCDISENAI